MTVSTGAPEVRGKRLPGRGRTRPAAAIEAGQRHTGCRRRRRPARGVDMRRLRLLVRSQRHAEARRRTWTRRLGPRRPHEAPTSSREQPCRPRPPKGGGRRAFPLHRHATRKRGEHDLAPVRELFRHHDLGCKTVQLMFLSLAPPRWPPIAAGRRSPWTTKTHNAPLQHLVSFAPVFIEPDGTSVPICWTARNAGPFLAPLQLRGCSARRMSRRTTQIRRVWQPVRR